MGSDAENKSGMESIACDFWQRRVNAATTRQELVYYWTECIGTYLKDNPKIIEIFRKRAADIDRGTKGQ